MVNVLDIISRDEASLALLAQLHRRAFEPQGDAVWQANAFRQLLDSPGVQASLFHQENQPVGFCLYRVVAGEAELISIAVDPLFQGQGLATFIMAYLLSALKQQQIEQLFLEVRRDNEAAINLYERHGLRQVGVRENYYKRADGSKIDGLMYSCNLA
ncbi:MAG: ribosomal protein S18-alanine N-acetyltransferase [Kordiimonas sp.]